MSTPSGNAETKTTSLVEIPKCPHAKPRLSPDDFGVQLVFVVVGKGDNARRFNVFKKLLTYHSSYFRAALEGNWIEGIENTVNLPEDNPDVFKAFHHWLYTGTLYSQLTMDGKIPLRPKLIVQVYMFGDARGIPDLCNASLDLLAQSSLSTWSFRSDIVAYVYENTPADCGLRKFLVTFGTQTFNWDRVSVAKFPKEYLVDVIVEAYAHDFGGRSRVRWAEYIKEFGKGLCNFHDHDKASTEATST